GLRRTVFTLETQRFNVLPLRYRRVFEKCDLILVPYELEFFQQCVPLEPFEDFKPKMMFFGNAIHPNTVRLLRKPKDEARASLHLPIQKTIVFCAYGRGEGAMKVVSTVVHAGEKLTAKNKDLLFILSDPTGEFQKACPPRDWLQFVGLDSEKALATLAACDCTIQGLGTNTLLEAMVAGKPMVAISLDRPYEEQASKGRGVASLGLGTHLPLGAVNEETIEDALLRTLEEGSTSQRSKALSTALGDLKGAERIAAELSRNI
ncbi:MAG: glycosyltransferase, partial [Candidatus Bathyarchaeia archaeon]